MASTYFESPEPEMTIGTSEEAPMFSNPALTRTSTRRPKSRKTLLLGAAFAVLAVGSAAAALLLTGGKTQYSNLSEDQAATAPVAIASAPVTTPAPVATAVTPAPEPVIAVSTPPPEALDVNPRPARVTHHATTSRRAAPGADESSADVSANVPAPQPAPMAAPQVIDVPPPAPPVTATPAPTVQP